MKKSVTITFGRYRGIVLAAGPGERITIKHQILTQYAKKEKSGSSGS